MAKEAKVAIVTGSGGGIGEATARALAQRGAQVIVADVRADAADHAAKRLQADGFTTVPVPGARPSFSPRRWRASSGPRAFGYLDHDGIHVDQGHLAGLATQTKTVVYLLRNGQLLAAPSRWPTL
jgi:NAD(P)-dependent dehydrogenase (short-subunit alcohol dehydrogenase family)